MAAQPTRSMFPTTPVDTGTLSQYSWYPINLFDPREGFPRDAAPPGMANPACYVNGIMNAVELDVGNFKKWLQGTVPGGSGPLVSYSSQNGYLVYFSDRRGMIANPDPGIGRDYQWRVWLRGCHQLGVGHRDSRRRLWSRLRTWT